MGVVSYIQDHDPVMREKERERETSKGVIFKTMRERWSVLVKAEKTILFTCTM